MFAMNIARTLATIRDHVSPKSPRFNSGVYEAICFNLQVWLTHREEERREVKVLVCGNNAVFCSTRPFGPPSQAKPVWTFEGRHESCWKDSIEQYLNKLYFELAEAILMRANEPELRPVDLNDNSGFNMFGNPWKVGFAKMSADPTDPHGYKLRLDSFA
jgi:hypothetical protein